MDKKIKWKNKGGGSFRFIPNKIIKPGEIFEASPDQIPLSFRDIIKPLDELPQEEVITGIDSSYKMEETAKGWYNVIDSSGKVVNEKKLRVTDAELLIKELEA